MTLLRSKKEFSFVNSRTARRHAPRPPIKPRHQQLANSTRKIESKANKTITQSRARNIRYLRHVRAYHLAAGDSANTLREKRRWLQIEHQAGRIHGKPFRELRDRYSKHEISKAKNRRLRDDGLTDAAKVAKQRLEEVFKQGLGARPAAGAVDQTLGDALSDAALGDPSDGEAVHDATGDDAAGQAVGEDTVSEEDSETDDESSTEADDPAYPLADNDAVARQRVLALGLQLADYSALDQDTGAHEDDREGEDEVEVKMEGEDA